AISPNPENQLLAASLPGLASFASNLFAAIANSFATVGLRRPQALDRSRQLADQGLVRRREHEQRALGVTRNHCADRSWQLDAGRVGQAEREVDGLALYLAAIARSDQLEGSLEAFGAAFDHVGH